MLWPALNCSLLAAEFTSRSGTVRLVKRGLTKRLIGGVTKSGVRGQGEVGLRVKTLTRLWNFSLVTHNFSNCYLI